MKIALVMTFGLALAGWGCNAQELVPVDDQAASNGVSDDAGADEGGPSEADRAACADLAEGDPCMTTDPAGEEVEGVCRSCHDGDLACSGGPGRHGGGDMHP